ncbi:CRO1 protein [Patellaria atrata CBS 101060]|uniref:CRO1 protein n=1 Tax=Patellaria atrata CBS 101060 TaxID=1346257 RepID=A0A9P4SGE3_9PEZI|nr:CRO1 protein [Patellaria atrata CBS 101060]
MTTAEDEKHAEKLADLANNYINSTELIQAARELRQASTIAPDNDAVKDSWKRLQEAESRGPLLRLCESWIANKHENDSNELSKLLSTRQVPEDVAEQAVKIFLEISSSDEATDRITGLILHQLGAKKHVAIQLQKVPTPTFCRLWQRGNESMSSLVSLLLDPNAWSSEEYRVAAQRDVFQLALAQLMEAGLEHPERAMKTISRLLAAESKNLNGLIDSHGFDVILENLDLRLPITLRSQATLATAKLLELSPDTAEELITKYVTKRVAHPTIEGLMLAFSASAAIFPIATAKAANLFLTPGFMEQFVHLVSDRGSQRLEQAALQLLSAACVDKQCREAINKNCKDWLHKISKSSTDSYKANLASLTLVKISGVDFSNSAVDSDSEEEEEDIISKFRNNLVLTADEASKQDSIEGLAYSSLEPKVKENLVKDQSFLKTLIGTLSDLENTKPLMYGGLTIFVNLSAYTPVQTEEQKKLAQLKAYANTSKPSGPHPLDDDSHVTSRCKKLLDVGVVPLLLSHSKRSSPALQGQMLQILLSLSKEQKHRGLMVQQGAVKLLIQICDTISNAQPSSGLSSFSPASSRVAAHALARLLISVNPAHVFSTASALPITSAIRMLVGLLEDDPTQEQRDLLPIFESLLALTNLASTDDNARDTIIRLAWPKIEDLLLANNKHVQRAAIELVCNLMQSPQGVAMYADGSKAAANRLHIMLALTNVDDVAARRAAGGALAVLTGWDAVVDAVIARDGGVRNLLSLCKEENEDLRHRAVVCVRNMVLASDGVGKRAVEKVRTENGVDILKDLLKKTNNQEILGTGVEALKAIV